MKEYLTPKIKSYFAVKIDRLNSMLKNINLVPKRRYDYWAIDIENKKGELIDTLVAGISLSDVEMIVECITKVLIREQQ